MNDKHPGGTYDRQQAMEIICEELANSDRSLWEICDKRKDLPSSRQVLRWLLEDSELCQQYARGKELQADFMSAQIRQIADESMVGEKHTIKADGSVETVRGDMVERSKLRIDARKWLASKLNPKKYGDKIDISGSIEHTGGSIDSLQTALAISNLLQVAAERAQAAGEQIDITPIIPPQIPGKE